MPFYASILRFKGDMRKEEACGLGRCLKPLLGRQRRYCSRSHRTLAYNGRQVERKKERARVNRLIYRLDSLTPEGRRALFLSVVYSLRTKLLKS